jgi:glycosyltransferase involved in cell wall biosynthesis
MTAAVQNVPRICFVGLQNLGLLAGEYGQLGTGGAELQQTLLARALARRGFPVSMVVADHGQSDGATWNGVQTYKAFRPEQGIPVLRFIHPRWTGLWSALARADADIYYTSCAGALVGQVALFARLRSRQFVFWAASDTDCDPRALLIRYRRDRHLYRYGLRRANLVFTQSPQQQQAMARNFGRESRVVESLIEPAAAPRPFSERDIDVLWVANLRPLKRPEVLFQLARQLPELRFHMIGGPMTGGEALFRAVAAEAATLPNVTFHGPVPYHAVGGFFSRARVFANTSSIEGFPNTYLQAWANGVPVVAFIDPQGLLSRLSLGQAVNATPEMIQAVARFARDLPAWEDVSRRSRKYMDDAHNESRVLTPYVEAFRALCLPRPAAPTTQPG